MTAIAMTTGTMPIPIHVRSLAEVREQRGVAISARATPAWLGRDPVVWLPKVVRIERQRRKIQS